MTLSETVILNPYSSTLGCISPENSLAWPEQPLSPKGPYVRFPA
jgi:hypothetical protein